ncbi:uncharacterized protein LOC111602045 [Drosophila hydei]|uniref:Uncharacterized protein LOC111602045 n=1 Tax=Drosophila hydei TaxID=7224 RepID=A0A6J1M8E9_DROHY|nr:uncharacterized protein LOC111602045 [Drosophila hydei]
MTRALIVIGLSLLFTMAPANYNFNSSEILRLGYNPTYDLWYFNPKGRPSAVSESVKSAYRKQKPGGVCYVDPDTWFFCKTFEPIN